MSLDEFEKSLQENAGNRREKKRIRSRVYAGFGDGCYRYGDSESALSYYRRALREDVWMPVVWGKWALVRTGRAGQIARQGFAGLRRAVAAK